MKIQLGYLNVGDKFSLNDEIWIIEYLDQSGSASGGPRCKRIKDNFVDSFWCGTFVIKL